MYTVHERDQLAIVVHTGRSDWGTYEQSRCTAIIVKVYIIGVHWSCTGRTGVHCTGRVAMYLIIVM